MTTKSQVFYGEYSLEHWVKLLETGNIILPEYQRSFQWKENQIKELKKSITNELFIPPVTIARMGKKNIILDGQQRLTSIFLLAKQKNKANNFDWKLEYDNETNTIKYFDDLDEYSYFEQNENIDDFLKNHFLGFSYLVPNFSDIKDEKEYFVNIFHQINTTGLPLTDDECRDAIYSLFQEVTKTQNKKIGLKDLLSPQKLTEFSVKNNKRQIDFLRYIGYLMQYKKHGEIKELLETNKDTRKNENIYHLIKNIGLQQDNDTYEPFLKFEIFYKRLSTYLLPILEKYIKLSENNPSLTTSFPTIIKSDLFFFGLLNYFIFDFLEEQLSIDKFTTILEEKSNEFKKILEKKSKIDTIIDEDSKTSEITNNNNNRQPNTPEKIKQRIEESIKFWNDFFKLTK